MQFHRHYVLNIEVHHHNQRIYQDNHRHQVFHKGHKDLNIYVLQTNYIKFNSKIKIIVFFEPRNYLLNLLLISGSVDHLPTIQAFENNVEKAFNSFSLGDKAGSFKAPIKPNLRSFVSGIL